MSRPSKYPLKPLLEHRDRHVDAATAALGTAVRERQAAESAKERAEQDRREEEARARVIREQEAEKLFGGELRVIDLARAEAWEVAAKAEMARRDAVVRDRTEAVVASRSTELDARGRLAETKADRDVVAKDRDKFVERQRQTAQAAEEEAAEEAWGGLRGRKA